MEETLNKHFAIGTGLFAALVVLTMMRTSQPAAQEAPASTTGSSLDFQVYRTRIEPIFVKQREDGVMCYNCHSILNTRLRLERMASGSTTWTEEQSRQNFEAVSKLVAPGEPLKSRLLLHPLAPEAGGDPIHTGGKFWKSQGDPEWQMIAEWVRSGSGAPAAQAAPPSSKAQSVDFEFFKASVEPIFLKKRPGHMRCFFCHARSTDCKGTAFCLENLSSGSTFWTEEQSRRNFEVVSRLVTPGEPLSSRLVMHPLSPDAGGDPFHDGGRQFESQNDPDWLTLVEWVRGHKAGGSSDQ
jgi:hypothetical protein